MSEGVPFRLGRVVGVREPGLRLIVPVIEVLRRKSLRDRDHAHPSPRASSPATRQRRRLGGRLLPGDRCDQVGGRDRERGRGHQPDRPDHLRKVVGQHTLDQTLAETDTINVAIREILDGTTEAWGVVVTLVELKDIQLPETMQRAMARQAEAEREKRAKIIAAEGEQLAADQLGRPRMS